VLQDPAFEHVDNASHHLDSERTIVTGKSRTSHEGQKQYRDIDTYYSLSAATRGGIEERGRRGERRKQIVQ